MPPVMSVPERCVIRPNMVSRWGGRVVAFGSSQWYPVRAQSTPSGVGQWARIVSRWSGRRSFGGPKLLVPASAPVSARLLLSRLLPAPVAPPPLLPLPCSPLNDGDERTVSSDPPLSRAERAVRLAVWRKPFRRLHPVQKRWRGAGSQNGFFGDGSRNLIRLPSRGHPGARGGQTERPFVDKAGQIAKPK